MELEKLMQALSLESYFEGAIIEKTFDHFHSRCAGELSYWSVAATRRKLINHFWLGYVGIHLAILLFLGVFACHCFLLDFSSTNLLGQFFILPVIFLVLFLSFYWPIYQLDFLPKLDSYAEHFSGKQLEGMQKCKKQQYSVLGLMLIQLAACKAAGIAYPSLAAEENNILVKLYGVSNKMIETSLKTVIQNGWDKTKERKRTEIQEAFEEAHEYFRVFRSEKAISHINELEQKLFTIKKKSTN